jgi:fatty acid desaturase
MNTSLDQHQLVDYHTIEHKYLLRIPIFLGLFFGSAFLVLLIQQLETDWYFQYLFCLPLYILAAASLHGISLFTHEGVHDVLSEQPLVNRLLSAFCAWPVLQNFSAYRVLHLRHHNHLAERKDPDHYHNYVQIPFFVFLLHWGRLLFGYPVYITAIPVMGFWHGDIRDKLWTLVEIIGVIGFVFALTLLPFELVLHSWLIPMMFIHFMVNIRGMSQHTLLENARDQIQGTRSILTNRVVTFFMCNENYHLEHHLYPKVPWYHLPKVHAVLQDGLVVAGAPYISTYREFVWDFIRASFQRKNVDTVSLDALEKG